MTTLTAPETAKPIEHILAHELSVKPPQIWAAIKLLDSGATVPFIARYRKEATGGLTDTHLRMLSDRLEYLRDLEKRRIEVLQSIQEQGKLIPVLKEAIEKAVTKAELEDLYLPFKPKRQSKAQTARDQGLESLAEQVFKNPNLDPYAAAKDFVDAKKGVKDAEAALTGAREILMERFSEDAQLTGSLREKFWKNGWIISKKKESKDLPGEAEKFRDYFNFREQMSKIPSHRMLAILRGRNEKILDVTLQPDGFSDFNSDRTQSEMDYLMPILQRFGIEQKRRPADSWLFETAKQAWKYKMRIRIELDLLSKLREKSDEDAIQVFAKNLKELLLSAPAGARATMGLDPGFRTGVKVAVVDKTAKVLETAVIYPHEPQTQWDLSLRSLLTLIKKHNVELIAIGNGTASRETDKLVSELFKRVPELKVNKLVVSEAGASVYSASELAAQEFPGMDVSLRGAVSIARRLQDPLAELVKIDPKSIGVGQYQHDVNQTRLGKMLNNVVEDCVNAVGVDVNTASVSLLSYVSGLTKRSAENLVKFRDLNGLFKNRLQFLKVAEFGPKTFEQAAGFLRIRNGENPLDMSAVHPESYPVVERILAKTQKSLKEIMGNRLILPSLKPEEFVDEKFGIPTVQDILQELDKPGRDPRPEFKTAVFREDIQKLEDLKPGMTLEGIITNVANFGAFVDIGVHQDGLIHVSELADTFVKDPHTIVKTGQLVKVKVLEVDIARKRISLSMRSQAASKKNPVNFMARMR